MVGTHLTDHYARTPQGQSPLGVSAVACVFDSGQGHTVKLLVADEPAGSFEEILAKAGISPAKCPALSGVGERAVACSGDGEAVVFAESGGRVVTAYRGGEPGGDALTTEATEIAKLIVTRN